MHTCALHAANVIMSDYTKLSQNNAKDGVKCTTCEQVLKDPVYKEDETRELSCEESVKVNN